MKYLIKDSTLTGIADAIRSKTGATDAIQTDQMAAMIEGIQTGGGASVETCTVNVNALDGSYITGCAYTAFENGEIVAHAVSNGTSSVNVYRSMVLENVVCNSAVAASFAGITFIGVSIENIERIGFTNNLSQGLYKAPPNAGDVATIEAYDND